jgi:hypothetical protein
MRHILVCLVVFKYLIHCPMSETVRFTLIKILHTAIWIFFNVVIFYLLYAVIANKIDKWVWVCIGLILLEALTLLIFKSICPVTLMARKYSNSQEPNFDIYLPNWLAKYNKEIYTVIVLVALIILGYRLTTG